MNSDTDSSRGTKKPLRFWLTVLCFAVFNAGIWMIELQTHKSPRYDVLRIDRFSPGEHATIGPRPTFSWKFNFDVFPGISSNRLIAKESTPGTITPIVQGRWNWKNARTLTFTPDDDLPKATKFTLTLPKERLKTSEGYQLAKSFIASVQTSPLQVQSCRQAAFDENDIYVLEIEFNDTVNPSEVLKHLEVQNPNQQMIPVRLVNDTAGRFVRVVTDPAPYVRAWSGEHYVTLHLDEGLTGMTGPLGLTQPYDQKLILDSELIATRIEAESPTRQKPYIKIYFNNEVSIETLKEVLSVEPAVPTNMIKEWSGIRLEGDFEAGRRYSVKINARPASSKNNGYPKSDVLSTTIPDRESGVWFEHEEGYLGSFGNRTLLAHAVNIPELKVSITRVYDNNLISWRNAVHQSRWTDSNPYSQTVTTRILPIPHEKNKVQDIRLALDELLPQGDLKDGAYLIKITANEENADSLEDEWSDSNYARNASALFTLSDIGLTAKLTKNGLVAWAVSLKNAKPLQGVRVRLFSDKNQFLATAMTDAEGLARLSNTTPSEGEKCALILADMPPAENGGVDDSQTSKVQNRGLTWLDLRKSELSLADFDVAGSSYLRSGYEAFLYTDRGVYRPGETVHFQAIVRGRDSTVPPSFPVRWQLRRPDLRNWKGQMMPLNPDGTSSLDLPLPSDLPTGRWTAVLGLPAEKGSLTSLGTVTFLVEEFVPDRMKVSLNIENAESSDRIGVSEKPLAVHFEANYLFGQPVANRDATLIARLDPSTFQPKGWTGWTFGDGAKTSEVWGQAKPQSQRIELPKMILDEQGKSKWELDLLGLLSKETSPLRTPWLLTLNTSVTEMGGRAVSASQTISVDTLPYYIGIKPASVGSAKPGVPFAFDLNLVSPGGDVAAKSEEIKGRLYRETWNNLLTFRDGYYRYDSKRVLEEDRSTEVPAIPIKKGRGTLSLIPPSGGSYVLVLQDELTHQSISIPFYSTESEGWDDNISRENPEKLEIKILPTANEKSTQSDLETLNEPSPDQSGKPKFRIGDEAQVIIRSPFAGLLFLTVETDDVVFTQTIPMMTSHISVPVRITEAMRPNAYVTASVIRQINPDAPWQNHRAFGTERLDVDNSDRKLILEMKAPEEIKPDHTLSVDLEVKNEKGQAIPNAAVTITAIDEGILRLTDFSTPDPLGFFMYPCALEVRSSDLYSELMPEVPKIAQASAVGGDGSDDYDPRHQSPVSGKRVKTLALVSGLLHTDANGRIHTEFTLSDFIGQIRLMAVGSHEQTFGSAQHTTYVKSPLIVQASWPRFASPKDQFRVPITVFNNTSSDGELTVKMELIDSEAPTKPNPLRFSGTQDRSITLQPLTIAHGKEGSLSASIQAMESTGVGHIKMTAQLNGETFRETMELPVRAANPIISRGGYGTASSEKPFQFTIPSGLLSTGQNFELQVTSFPDLQITTGLDTLNRYPYGCAEQTISTSFPLVYLSDIGERVSPGSFDAARITEKVQVGVTRLMSMQTSDGGLAMWPGYAESWPWASVYGAHFLMEAQSKGYAVPQDFFDRLMIYIKRLLDKSSDEENTLESQAYACYLLALAGKPQIDSMNRLGEVIKDLSQKSSSKLETSLSSPRSFLAAAWLASGRRDLAMGLIPQTLPQPRSQRQLSGNVGSPIRDRALMISTLLDVEPDHPELPALVEQLAKAGRAGKWQSTQDTAFAVMALGRYLKTHMDEPKFETAELMINGESVSKSDAENPLFWKTDIIKDTATLEVRVTGPTGAKAYVSWLQTGIPSEPLDEADHGLKIRRRYLNESGAPVNLNEIHSGDLIQIELQLEAMQYQDHLVIEDLLPAGFEIENPRLATSAQEVSDPKTPKFQDSRMDIRDDRLVLFGKMNYTGIVNYHYLARAVTCGDFTVPPVRVECMYDTGLNSLSGSANKITVLERTKGNG